MTTHSTVETSRCGCDDPRHLEGLLTVDEAAGIARRITEPVRETELVDLRNAAGRVVSRDIHAPQAMPFFDQSAMDGFAIRCADLHGQGPWALAVHGTTAAGDRAPDVIIPGETAQRIFTGAPVPGGTDAVVMIEDCDDRGASVIVRHCPRTGENIRDCGSDIRRGAQLVTAGTKIEPRHVGLLAANGYSTLNVFRRPRIGIFSTGRELVVRGEQGNRQIFDANRPMLLALTESIGAEACDLGIVDDDADQTASFFTRHADEFDMLVSSGAVSAGGRDFIRPSFRQAGGVVHAWKVALKPGKPVLFGTLGRSVYLGLPGNPLAAFIGFALFGREQILRLGGHSNPRGHEIRALSGFASLRKTGRTEYTPARITGYSPEGLPVIETIGNGSSGTLLPLCHADGIAVVPASVSKIEPGDPLGFLP
jgi:molybdopterin molybdotransferase